MFSSTSNNKTGVGAGSEPTVSYPGGDRGDATLQDASGNIAPAFTVTLYDSAGPVLKALNSTTANNTYGPGDTIDIRGYYTESLANNGATIQVDLNNGVSDLVLDNINSSELYGTYTVGVTGSGEDITDLNI